MAISFDDVRRFALEVSEDTGASRSLKKWKSIPSLAQVKLNRAVASFGEGTTRGVLVDKGWDVRDRRNAQHDLQARKEPHLPLDQWEVKTSFQSEQGVFWFNQMGQRTPGQDKPKDFNVLCFVFVSPESISIWYASVSSELFQEMTTNNGYEWKGKGPQDLSDKWTCLYEVACEQEVVAEATPAQVVSLKQFISSLDTNRFQFDDTQLPCQMEWVDVDRHGNKVSSYLDAHTVARCVMCIGDELEDYELPEQYRNTIVKVL